MRSKAIFVLVIMVLLFAFENQSQADIDIQDGGVHVIDHNQYSSRSIYVYVDRTINNNPGTHLDLVNGGNIGKLYMFQKSSLNMTGGTINSLLRGWGNSTITISGGSIYDFYTLDNSTATMTGGMVQGTLAAGFNSIITMSGGSFGKTMAYYNGIINLVGTDFKVDGTPLSYGDKLSNFATFYPIIPDGQGYYTNCYSGTITGRLADGSYLNNTFIIDATGTANIYVVPEPATLLLLGLGGLVLRKHRR